MLVNDSGKNSKLLRLKDLLLSDLALSKKMILSHNC